MSDVHTRLREAVAAKLPSDVVDSILNSCTDMECYTCGEICCPYNEPLHFHHDGCPACAEHDA